MTQQAPDASRWRGYTHKDLYRLLHEGAGPAASAEPSRRWGEIAAALGEVGQDLHHALELSGSGWTGKAAGAAYDRLSGLVNWAQQTSSNASEMRQAVENQAEYLAKARADMPAPEDTPAAQPDPTAAAVPAASVIAATKDNEPVEAAMAAGEQRAFEVMAAYQRNTDVNTSGLASFTPPAELLGSGTSNMHRSRGPGVQVTTPVGTISVGTGPVPSPRPEHDHGHHHWGDGSGWDNTWSSGAIGGDVVHYRPQPGSFTVAAPMNEPLFGLSPFGSIGSDSGRTSGGGGRIDGSTGTGSGGRPGGTPMTSGLTAGGSPSSGPNIGSGTGPVGTHSPADFQSAAAGQAAAAAGTPAAATPGATAGTGAGLTGGGDRGVMRRLGMDAIGSGTWFGDSPDYEIRGAAPNRRRRDFADDDHVTEAVSIDGEEHRLPPTVIGDS